MLAEISLSSRSPEALRARIRWLLAARVVIVTVFLGATALSALGADNGVLPIRGVASLLAVAYFFTLLSLLALPRITDFAAFNLLQITIDIGLISTAIPLTGGLRSPTAVWYNLAIIGAAVLELRRGAYAAAALSSLVYGILMNLLYYSALPLGWTGLLIAPEPGLGIVYQISANIVSFFSIAFLSSVLVERAARTERALEWSEADRHRIEEESRRMEAEHERLETLQRTLVQNLESGVLTTDAVGRITSANRALQLILGRALEDLIGRPIGEIFPILRPPVGAKPVLDPSPTPLELSYRAKPDGVEQILRCTIAPLTDTYQNLIGTLFILQDITSVQRLLQQGDTAPVENEVAAALSGTPGILPPVSGFLGQSRRIREVYEILRKVAPTDATILVTGESGTGKELAARAVHALSPRRERPMVVVNCAAIPENLIESELFGHVRGSFTGAVADRRGLFRAAEGGTIFLDEVGDLPLALQVKLLRVLQERSFTPVGAQAQVVVDVRIIAATNRDLEADVAGGRFREDLFYRLNVIRIEMPPLRERADDLPLLINHFLQRFAETLHKPVPRLSPPAGRRLLGYGYPGNIRELENVLEHAVALCNGELIDEEDLPGAILGAHPAAVRNDEIRPQTERPPTLDSMKERGSNLDSELETFERRLLEEALRRAGGVRKRAAELLGINYRSLRHRLSKYGFGDADDREVRE